MLSLRNVNLIRLSCCILGILLVVMGLRWILPKFPALRLATPKNVHELRSFLGLANYFRKFVMAYLSQDSRLDKTDWQK